MSIVSPESVDIGYGAKCTSSSGIENKYNAVRLQPSTLVGGYFFHTLYEERPWLQIDLGDVWEVSAINIFNREEWGDQDRSRCVPLLVQTASEPDEFQNITLWTQPFGGRITNSPLQIPLMPGVKLRFIRLTVQKADFFHLDYVEVLAKAPKLRHGSAHNLSREKNRLLCDYSHFGNSGLFSALSTALSDISTLSKSGIDIRSIDFGMSFMNFKSKVGDDVFQRYFTSKTFAPFADSGVHGFKWQDAHLRYRDMDLRGMQFLARNYFSPSQEMLSCIAEMNDRVGIVSRNTIAIVYRGTDKGTEVKLASPVDYIAVAQELIDADPNLDVVVQTDQREARTQVIEAFGDKCRYFEELPVSDGDQAIHLDFNKIAGDLKIDDFTLSMMSATILLSSAKYVITHTGNVSAWLCFYRGTKEGVFQFDENGTLVRPE